MAGFCRLIWRMAAHWPVLLRVPSSGTHALCLSAEPGPYQAPAFVTVPALRSGMKNAAARPGHGGLLRSATLMRHVDVSGGVLEGAPAQQFRGKRRCDRLPAEHMRVGRLRQR